MLSSARCSGILRPARFLIHRRSFRAPTTALNHCVEVVRQQDRERFLCNTCVRSPAPRKHFCHTRKHVLGRFAAHEARPALFALHGA